MSQCSGSSGYTPDATVTAFHRIPHVDINLQPVSPEFSPDLNYFQPIIIWACVPILACVCLFILLSVYYICICCCCCCRDKKARPKVVKIVCAFFVCLVILFCLGMIGAGIYAEVELDRFVNGFVTNVRGIDNTVNDVTVELNTYPSGSINRALVSITTAIPSSSAPDAEKEVALRVVNELLNVNTQIRQGIATVNGSSRSVQFADTLDTILNIEVIRHWSVIGYFAFIVVVLLLVFVVTVCMSPIGMVILLIILGIVTLTVWIVAGAGLGIVVTLSDICFDPDSVIRNNTPSSASDVVDYYISCSASCENPFAQDLMLVRELAEGSRDNSSVLLRFVDMYISEQRENAVIVQNGFMTGHNIANNVTNELTCNRNSGIHEDYMEALRNLCSTGGFLFALILFAIVAGLAISLLLLMCCLTGFTGLLANTRPDEVDRDDFLALETEHTVAWNNRRASYTEPYSSSANGTSSYRAVREEYPLQPTGNSTLGVIEPPQYSDLPRQPGRPNSGDYDHFDA